MALRPNLVLAHQRQRKRPFGLVAGQSGGRIQHAVQFVTVGQFALFGGNAAGDFGQLLAAGQLVLDDHKVLFQFDRDLDHG